MKTLVKMQFDPEIAKDIGVEEAIMYSNIEYWVAKNEANEKNKHDGCYWTYNSIVAFEKLFNFWSKGQIERILKKLEKLDYIKIGNYNKHKYDRTKWYSCKNSKEEMHFLKSGNGVGENEKPIPNSKPNDKQLSKDSSKSYGREDINQSIEFLKEKNNGMIDGTIKENRQYATLLINKIKKAYPGEDTIKQIEIIIQTALQDEFHSKNATSMKYLYYNTQKIIQTVRSKQNRVVEI